MAWRAVVVVWAIAAVLLMADTVRDIATAETGEGELLGVVGYFMAALGTITALAQLMSNGKDDEPKRRRKRKRPKP